MDTGGLRLSAWEYEQLKKEHTLDCVLFLVSSVSIVIITLVCLNIPAGLLYYLQDDIKRGYLRGLSRVDRYAYYFDNWHLLLMYIGALGLLHHYPSYYDEWIKQKRREENSNLLFRKIVYGMVLIFSFILHLTKIPYGYTDSEVLYIYRAVSIGLVVLTVLTNYIVVYFVNRRKCYEYYGVDNYFPRVIVKIYFLCFVACLVMIYNILPWICC